MCRRYIIHTCLLSRVHVHNFTLSAARSAADRVFTIDCSAPSIRNSTPHTSHVMTWSIRSKYALVPVRPPVSAYVLSYVSTSNDNIATRIQRAHSHITHLAQHGCEIFKREQRRQFRQPLWQSTFCRNVDRSSFARVPSRLRLIAGIRARFLNTSDELACNCYVKSDASAAIWTAICRQRVTRTCCWSK